MKLFGIVALVYFLTGSYSYIECVKYDLREWGQLVSYQAHGKITCAVLSFFPPAGPLMTLYLRGPLSEQGRTVLARKDRP
jgi:hypothetical protein